MAVLRERVPVVAERLPNMKKYLIPLLALLFGAKYAVHAQAKNPKYTQRLKELYHNTVPTISPEAARDRLESEEDILLLDTRAPREYEVSHISGAQFVDFDGFKKKDVAGVPRDQPVIVYCSVGYRSERIGERLQKLGFTQVYNLYGGIFEWKNQGFKVVNQENQDTEFIHTYNEDWGQWLDKGEKVVR